MRTLLVAGMGGMTFAGLEVIAYLRRRRQIRSCVNCGSQSRFGFSNQAESATKDVGADRYDLDRVAVQVQSLLPSPRDAVPFIESPSTVPVNVTVASPFGENLNVILLPSMVPVTG
jgi:hypothetical protein